MDREQRLVTLRGTELSLTRREYALLAALTCWLSIRTFRRRLDK